MKARIIHSLSPASERNLARYMARRKRRKHEEMEMSDNRSLLLKLRDYYDETESAELELWLGRAIDRIADLERQLADQTATASRQATLTIAALARLREVARHLSGSAQAGVAIGHLFNQFGPTLTDGLEGE
jgi:hypothetical protein